MRKHCSNVCKFRPCLATINKLGTHAHNRDRSAAGAIFANGTYFLDNPRVYMYVYIYIYVCVCMYVCINTDSYILFDSLSL